MDNVSATYILVANIHNEPEQNEMVMFAQAHEMYDRVPMKNKSILPDEGFPAMPVNIASKWNKGGEFIRMVYCKPLPAPGVRWGHRIMVVCECGKDIPFGRMNQHFPKCVKAN